MSKDLVVANRHWLIWPTGATEWMLSYSDALAKKAKRKGWGCIEFRAVPDEIERLAHDIVDGALS
jgi:predicted lipoprotein